MPARPTGGSAAASSRCSPSTSSTRPGLTTWPGSTGPAWWPEPLLLLMLGLTVDQPAAMPALGRVLAGVDGRRGGALRARAAAIGVDGAHQDGYVYGSRSGRSHPAASFGTLDEPFAYAAFLLLGLAAVLAWRRRGLLPVARLRDRRRRAGDLVRAHRAGHRRRPAGALDLAPRAGSSPSPSPVSALVVGLNIVTTSNHASSTRSVDQGGSLITLNGRTSVWARPRRGRRTGSWAAASGRGTGERAGPDLGLKRTSAQEATSRTGRPPSSGYLATIAGPRLRARAGRAAPRSAGGAPLSRVGHRRGDPAGWIAAAGLPVVVLLDAPVVCQARRSPRSPTPSSAPGHRARPHGRGRGRARGARGHPPRRRAAR